MVLHGTGGTGKQFLRPQFADELYGPGQPLDIRRYCVILPDNIGHGGSSKPSDGLRMQFPKYDYDDMVEAQRRMLTEGLGVTHLRLIMGTSMGCMHGFVWGETLSRFRQRADAAWPASRSRSPASTGCGASWRSTGSRRTRPGRRAITDAADDRACARAQNLLFVAGAAPLTYQAQYPTRAAASAYAEERVAAAIQKLDANDLIYQLDASRNYNPWPQLERIRAPMTWINSADDFINPRNFAFPQQALKRMPTARFRLIPESARDPRPRHPHLGEVLEGRPGRAVGALGRRREPAVSQLKLADDDRVALAAEHDAVALLPAVQQPAALACLQRGEAGCGRAARPSKAPARRARSR